MTQHKKRNSNGKIKLQNVTYVYPNKKKVSFPDMIFKKGNKYIIQGESGKGKSTLLKILSGDYRTYEGTIMINNRDLSKIPLVDLKRKVAVVDQKTHIFNATLKENIILNTSYDSVKLNKVLKNSRLDKLVNSLPNGINTVMDDNNVTLSGGQIQRISIARAMYHDREILIMDEGTSSLDKNNALMIERNLIDNPSITLIMVTHNLYEEVADLVDEIYVL